MPGALTADPGSVPRQKNRTANASVPTATYQGDPAQEALTHQGDPAQEALRPAGLPRFADLLEHPDPAAAANAAGVENLLRCWIRERNLTPESSGATLRIALSASHLTLLVPVHYWSPTGWHRLGPPAFETAPAGAPPVDAVTLAALLGRETTGAGQGHTDGAGQGHTDGAGQGHSDGAGQPEPAPAPAWPDVGDTSDLVGRVADSVRRTAAFLTHRRQATKSPDSAPTPATFPGLSAPGPAATDLATADLPATGPATADLAAADLSATGPATADLSAPGPASTDLPTPDPTTPDLFLTAEQSLVLGHPLHPTPKSREGLSEAEAVRYSPEAYGSFALHWMAVAPDALAADSAWTERGRTVTAEQLAARLAGPAAEQAASALGAELPDGYALLPLHPWQASDLAHRPEVADLMDRGLIRDLGPLGDSWYPTSSVRTVYRPGAPAMLKLSLGLRITNSRRENLHKELHRGVEVHRLLRSGLSAEWQSAHPGFDIVRDPAWLAVVDADGAPVPGLDTVIRNNPFAPDDDVTCIAGLVSPRPVRADGEAAAEPGAPMRSRLAELVGTLAARTGRPRGAVAAEWFLRYLEQVVRPVLWLDGVAGIALEAHQQNTLVVLDPDGWPVGGRYRDNQGYYFRASRRSELDKRLPGIGLHSDTFVADAVTDERFAYYLGINNVLGLIGAFGSQQLADERLLLAAFRRFLAECASGGDAPRSPLPGQLLDTPVLRCKANLLTRLHGLDELIGPVDTQSVYVTIPNPLHSSRT
ncbi:iron transporter [Streptomyces sp. TRM66268-LWL]|uniref:Iron transporter n=2 Tax=Streptomyces polyasparticus TaxID=2767826 RepID=A0ABR7SUP9_9ACTN|nr:iron transporter [Streptomyces polyasparticus]